MKRKGIVLCLALILAAGGLAVANELDAVDITKAQDEIAALREDITEAQAEIGEAETTIQEDEATVVQLNADASEVRSYLSQIREEITDLSAFERKVADEELKKQTSESLLRAIGIKNSLTDKLKSLNEEIRATQNRIAENRKLIRINNSVIARKNERIYYLEAAVKVTEEQQEKARAYIENVEGILSQAESYINDSDAGSE